MKKFRVEPSSVSAAQCAHTLDPGMRFEQCEPMADTRCTRGAETSCLSALDLHWTKGTRSPLAHTTIDVWPQGPDVPVLRERAVASVILLGDSV